MDPLSHQSSEDSIGLAGGPQEERETTPNRRTTAAKHRHRESEIGQADKHVLRNVGRVERFIQDVIRKSIVEELVFPNFHTKLILWDRSQLPSPRDPESYNDDRVL